MKPELQKIAIGLAQHQLVKVGEFKLSSGIMSPYYVDLRAMPSHPELFDWVTDAYAAELKSSGLAFNRIAGVATAGVPIATLVAYKLKKPFLYVRKEERNHGTKSLVEGVIEPGDPVIVVDDVVTTGGNLLRTIEALRERGAKVEYVLVLVDREQGASENLAKIGVKLIALLTSSELIRELYLKELVGKEDYDKVINYIRGDKGV
jgi:orotate phosphoribosyltransferase